MKVVGIVLLCLLAGCVARPTLEELETQAMLTGDWSAVEKRERSIERRRARTGIECDIGLTAYCEITAGHRACTCVSSRSLSMTIWR